MIYCQSSILQENYVKLLKSPFLSFCVSPTYGKVGPSLGFITSISDAQRAGKKGKLGGEKIKIKPG